MQFVQKKRIGKSAKWKIKDHIEFDPEVIFAAKDTLRDDPLCRVIKDNNVRCSMFVTAGNSEKVFLKIYKQRNWKDAFKYTFFTSKALSEWKALNKFSRIGLPVPKTLAVYEEKQFGLLKKSCLFIEAIPNSLTLNALNKAFFSSPLAKNKLVLKKKLIRRLAGLISSIHSKGIFYRDLHGGNILVYLNEKQNLHFSFIDLHKAKFLPFLPMWFKIYDLAKLLQTFSPKTTDAFYFFTEYAKNSLILPDDIKKYATKIKRRVSKLQTKHIRSRTKRCMIKSSGFVVIKRKGQRAYLRKEYDKTLDLILRHIKINTNQKSSILKESKKSKLFWLSIDNDQMAKKICVKKDLHPGFFYKIKNIMRNSRAKRSWIASNGLRVRGISTPESIALIENTKGLFIKKSFYIYEYISHAERLNKYILKTFGDKISVTTKRKQKFVCMLAQEIRKIHNKGIYHADLKSDNILVVENGNDNWQFYFVDLDRVYFKKRLSLKERVNNLAQINASVADCISVSDRIYFFNEYAKKSSFIKQNKKIYRQIIKIGKTKNTHYYGVDFTVK